MITKNIQQIVQLYARQSNNRSQQKGELCALVISSNDASQLIEQLIDKLISFQRRESNRETKEIKETEDTVEKIQNNLMDQLITMISTLNEEEKEQAYEVTESLREQIREKELIFTKIATIIRETNKSNEEKVKAIKLLLI